MPSRNARPRWLPAAVVLGSLLAPGRASALPPNADPHYRDGANHHLGDDGFVTEFGREPTPAEEHLRTHAHLVAVRALLGGRPATRPELGARRTELLRYLDDYIAAGTTPMNDHLPWRSPVFIDDAGRICAVGYLIERSVGRPLASRIGGAHRYDFLEDIAAAMPEVRAWVASSGLTLDELASIQPGYERPMVETWSPWDLREGPLGDGPFEGTSEDGTTTHGTIEAGQMAGSWTRVDAHGAAVGAGQFARGAGTWRSVYPEGGTMAEGPYAGSRPHGLWRFYHASGALAARGLFDRGYRAGPWIFYHDTPQRTPIATGSFHAGHIGGTWEHFDAAGKLLAVSTDANPREWTGSFGGYLLDVLPGEDGIRHQIHQGDVQGDHHRLDAIVSRGGRERLYVRERGNAMFDARGQQLERADDGAWQTCDAGFDLARRRAVAAGDLARLHGLLYRDAEPTPCENARPVPPARARRLSRLFTSVRAVRAQSPDFVRRLALGDSVEEAEAGAPADTPPTQLADVHDLAKVLAANMTWYVEWPHVDGRFVQVFRTLPGYATRDR